jgi:hypothetical protein
MGVDFFNRCVQPLRQREITIWMYPGPSCPDRPFSIELNDMEINTWIRGVLTHGADQNFGFGLVPLREWVLSPCVSLLKLTFVCLYQFQFLSTYAFLHRILDTRNASWGVTLPEDVVRWEATMPTTNDCGHGGK